MKVLKRQKINTLLSAAVAAITGSMLAGGYGMDSQVFFWILGGGIFITGLVQAAQDATAKQPLFGSSDIMIGVSKMAAGGVIALNQALSARYVLQILAGMAFFHGLYLLQQAVEVRRLQKMEAGIMLAAAAFAAVAGVEILLAFSEIPLGIELCLFVDAGALLLSGILMFLVKPAAPQPAKKAAPATAAKPVPKSAPAQGGTPALGEKTAPASNVTPAQSAVQEIAPAAAAAATSAVAADMAPDMAPDMLPDMAEPAPLRAATDAAESAAPDMAEAAPLRAATDAAESTAPDMASTPATAGVSAAPATGSAAAPVPPAEPDSSYALHKLGSFASKAGQRMRSMAKDTVSSFQEGLHDGENH